MFRSSCYFVSRIVLFAMLFSAVSPALAALRFYGNAEVLANLISEHPAAHRAAGHDHAAHHGHAAHAESKTPEIVCSFCLDMASVQALAPTVPRLLPDPFLTQARLCTVEHCAQLALSYSPQNPRAPPFPLV